MNELSRIGGRNGGIRVAVVVAHPDDETLWAGGLILNHPLWEWHIIALCRKSDRDRAPRFRRAMGVYGARGALGDLDDGPGQEPLEAEEVRESILALLPSRRFNLVLTHDRGGEYTRHRRHEETGRSMMELWNAGEIRAPRLWMFAYGDDGGKRLPRPLPDADLAYRLRSGIWRKKYGVITQIYGFSEDSFEARTTPRGEAFHCFER